MTVQQLLSWVAFAHDQHDCSFDEVTGKHSLCLKQTLLAAEPKIESHGYGTSEGERELAIVLIHTCNYQEVCDMENDAFNISKEPLNIPTQVSRPPDGEPAFYISATEAIRQAEANRIVANIHNPPEYLPPVGEILYESRPIPGMAPAYPAPPPSMPPIVPYTMGEVTTMRDLTEEVSRQVLSEIVAETTSTPTQGATVANPTINNEFERFFGSQGL